MPLANSAVPDSECSAFAPIAVPRPRGKLAGLLRTFMRSRPSRQRLRQRGILRQRVFGCDLGEHLSNSGQDGEAWDLSLMLPQCSSGPDPAPLSQCPKCYAAALSLLRPMVWWMESTGSQACPPTSRGFGEHPQPAFISNFCPSSMLQARVTCFGS